MNNLDTNFPNDEIFYSAPKPQHFHTKDETIRIVGNKMYKRPKDEHLHGFIRNLLGYTLKKHWVNAQLQLAFEERHKIMQWVKAEEIFMKKIE
ncbi:MAG: hypothetical protein LH472_15060, partial [Pyrinomonadaceae bacterium]|nr:hypothetical protein [Pyrinomonadaceae bacterium]